VNQGVAGVGWRCDLSATPGLCRNITASFQTIGRYRCAQCDFDLCQSCYIFKGGSSDAPGADAPTFTPGNSFVSPVVQQRVSGGQQAHIFGAGSNHSLASRMSGSSAGDNRSSRGAAGGARGVFSAPNSRRPNKLLDYEVEDLIPDDPCLKHLAGCGLLVFFILIILFFPCTVTQIGQYKVGLLRNKISGVVVLDKVYTPGRYWIGFWKDFIEFPTTLSTIEFSEDEPEETVQHLSALRARDRDGKHVVLDLTIQYLLKPDEVGELYREVLDIYEDLYISLLRDVFNKALNELSVSQVWEDGGLRQSFHEKCKQTLATYHATCWGVQLQGVRLDPKYEAALTKTQVKKQMKIVEDYRKQAVSVRWDTKVLLAAFTRNITLLQANGDAKVYQLNREAIAIAEANLVSAQAKSLTVIKSTVVAEATAAHGALALTSLNLVEYQKNVVMHMKTEAHFIKGGGANSGQRRLAQRLRQEGDDLSVTENGQPEASSRRLLADMLLTHTLPQTEL